MNDFSKCVTKEDEISFKKKRQEFENLGEDLAKKMIEDIEMMSHDYPPAAALEFMTSANYSALVTVAYAMGQVAGIAEAIGALAPDETGKPVLHGNCRKTFLAAYEGGVEQGKESPAVKQIKEEYNFFEVRGED